MGCAFGKEISESGSPSGGNVVVDRRREKAREREPSVPAESRDKVVESSVSKPEGGEVQNGGIKKEDLKDGIVSKSRHEKRRLRPNPRLSNPPKNVHGEQVAAGWPSWLVSVAGEALSGWVPRRADTFEKLDKASLIFSSGCLSVCLASLLAFFFLLFYSLCVFFYV